MIKLTFPQDHTPIEQTNLWDMFLDTLEENQVSYTIEQLDLVHKHIKMLEQDLENAE